VKHPKFRAMRDSARLRVGKWLFELFWTRVQVLVQVGIKHCRNEQGLVPAWFLVLFDVLVWLMWFYHDNFHAKLFGRGDGL
jgi:gliotoxin/aspirochlorine biosynthesis gamma-glutamylcyclotransferase